VALPATRALRNGKRGGDVEYALCGETGRVSGRLWLSERSGNVRRQGAPHQGAPHSVAARHRRWPTNEIDHENGLRLDNCLDNLREATPGENQQNGGPSPHNTSGFRGVTWDRWKAKWKAQIQVDGRRIFCGYFDTTEAAFMAYLDARVRFFPFQIEPRGMTAREAAAEADWWFSRRRWRAELRGPGESHSDVILRAATESARRARP
jgi:hypothetical protein